MQELILVITVACLLMAIASITGAYLGMMIYEIIHKWRNKK